MRRLAPARAQGRHGAYRYVAAGLVLVLLLTCGCSHYLVRRAPPDPVPPQRWVLCTENRLWPIVDTVYAVSLLAPLVYAAVNPGDALDDDERTLLLAVGIPFFGAAGVGYGLSARAGFRETARCNDVHQAYEAEVQRVLDASGGDTPRAPAP